MGPRHASPLGLSTVNDAFDFPDTALYREATQSSSYFASLFPRGLTGTRGDGLHSQISGHNHYFGLRIQPVDATDYRLREQERVANGLQTRPSFSTE
jgi:hypothetical protein